MTRSSIIFLFLFFISIHAKCPHSSYQSPSGKCFSLVLTKPDIWSNAESSCQKLGGHLAAVQNTFDNALIVGLAEEAFKDATDWWLGGHFDDASASWIWSDGSNFSYANWAPGQPNTLLKCLVEQNNGQWKSDACNHFHPHVCEVPSEVDNSTGAPPTTSTPPKCLNSWNYDSVTNKCYFLLPEWYDWNTTRTYCLQYGADLPIIRNQAENNAIKKLAIFNEWDHFFLGLMNVNLDGNWVWIQDGSLANYTNWVPSQPDINNVIAGYYSTDEIECCSAGQWYSFALDDMIPGLCAMHAF